MEEKYGRSSAPKVGSLGFEDGEDDATRSSTDSEEEDDEGVLASGALDAQFQDTLKAIRRRDPRVYDEKAVFYTDPDEGAHNGVDSNVKKERPMYLSDYHRRNLFEGAAAADGPDDEPMTYAQQQDDLKNVIVKEMHAAATKNNDAGDNENGSNEFNESNNDFLVRKATIQEEVGPKEASRNVQDVDVEAAEKDPETFLSNFMSARAWVSSVGSKFQPFESDDEEDDRQAELFEEAYNLRFEDPNTSNEKIMSHARDAVAKYSVRKEITNPRKKARDAEREKKEAARQIREEEKARLRKLKVAEAEEKIMRIKEAAGIRGTSLQEHDWSSFLEDGWDDALWEEEMKKRFGDGYYEDHDSEGSPEGEGKKRKMKKPKWDDDIDIGDLVPDFDTAENEKQHFALTDDESNIGGAPIQSSENSGSENREPSIRPKSKQKTKRKRESEEQRKGARKQRRKIEQLVDEGMKVDETLSTFGKKHAGHFRYRETSPIAYGLTAKDILMASDSQLNQYAGLKKMAAFRDSEKKKKDKKRLGKKARLRQWRKETFGDEQGPQKSFAESFAGQDGAARRVDPNEAGGIDIREATKKKTRSRKSKTKASS